MTKKFGVWGHWGWGMGGANIATRGVTTKGRIFNSGKKEEQRDF